MDDFSLESNETFSVAIIIPPEFMNVLPGIDAINVTISDNDGEQ